MADKFRFKLNEKGLNQALREHVSKALESKAKDVASKVAADIGPDTEVSVHSGTTRRGRPYTMITIRDPRGLIWEAKRSTLAKSAISSGIDVNRYPIT